MDDAYCDQNYRSPPYKAEVVTRYGWACVLNAQGINVLRFRSKPGAVFAPLDECEALALQWNNAIVA